MEYEEKEALSSESDNQDSDVLSETEEDIPDPNDSNEPLYQDANKLPEDLQKHHFEEGLVYAMTLDSNHKVMMLGMIIELKETTFVWRTFFYRGAKRKTYHQGAKDAEYQYLDVWRLAPRRELTRRQDPRTARFGQTLRFEYGIGSGAFLVTALVIGTSSRKIRGLVECGMNRGEELDFDIPEITDCQEIFGSSVLASLLERTMKMSWSAGPKTKTREIPEHKPRLSPDFMVPTEEQNKRK